MKPLQFGTGRRKDLGNPGEPLFTIDEIAQRLGVKSGNVLCGLMRKHPGLPVWAEPRQRSAAGTGRLNKYRLSDARRWWAEVQK